MRHMILLSSSYSTFERIGYHIAFDETYKRMVKFTRIAFANDGFDMLKSIDYILEKYKDYTASELVSLTHRPDSAWSKCYVEGQKNTIIPDDVIVKCLY